MLQNTHVVEVKSPNIIRDNGDKPARYIKGDAHHILQLLVHDAEATKQSLICLLLLTCPAREDMFECILSRSGRSLT